MTAKRPFDMISPKHMRLRHLLAATALFATQPAAAGITAHYRTGQGPEQGSMTIEVNDRGDSRVDIGDGRTMLVLDGVAYVVERDSEGVYAARMDDVFELSIVRLDGSRRPSNGPILALPPQPAPPRVRLERGGIETVAGQRGTLWRIVDPAAPGGVGAQEIVVSDDPALAPLRGVLGTRETDAPNPAFDPNGAARARWTIHQRGAITREGRHLRLERVRIHPMPNAFTLPAPPLGREALAARMQRAGR